MLRRLEVLRSVLAAAVLVVAVLSPGERHSVTIATGVLLIGLSLAELKAAVRLEPVGRSAGVLRALAPLVGALVLLLGLDGDPTATIASAAGALLVVRGAADALAAVTVGARLQARAWLGTLAAGEATIGAVAVLATDLFGQAAIVTLGFAWLLSGAAAAFAPAPPAVARLTLAPIVTPGPMADDERARIADEVALDGPDVATRLMRFTVLLVIAAVIATYGVLSDSVAAVIGGMIVAPLMVPIQALTAALVAGSAARAGRAGLVLLGGVVGVLFVAILIASTDRDLLIELQNAQVVSRVNPGLADLAIALAAGTAGGFALVRRDVSGALPGVAIAVSLVPPLCVSGASIAGGMARNAAGAFLLFSVNFVAIVIAVGFVLTVAGFGAAVGRRSRRVLTISVAFGVALALLSVPLASAGRTVILTGTLDTVARTELADWLKGTPGAKVLAVAVREKDVSVLVVSETRPKRRTAELTRNVSDEVGYDVRIRVRWVQATTLP